MKTYFTASPQHLAAIAAALLGGSPMTPALASSARIERQPRQWHKLTFSWEGPEASETGTPNPFTDYRLTVTFSHQASGQSWRVPGYFAADGHAADTGAQAGSIWRAHFAPPQNRRLDL